jgi:hypothetical protein
VSLAAVGGGHTIVLVFESKKQPACAVLENSSKIGIAKYRPILRTAISSSEGL